MIYDDLPTNTDYLDESFGAAAGLREILDEDVDEFDQNEYGKGIGQEDPHIISRVGGETIKVFHDHGLALVEDYYLNIPPDNSQSRTEYAF
jgi:autophagy-related protein 2